MQPMSSPVPGPSPDFAASGLLRELKGVLDPGAVITEQEARGAYECDGLSAYRQLPPVVARPVDTDQVRAVMRICRRHGVPVVARGAGTGLSGGALPHPGAVLLSLARLSEVLEVDPLNRTARVQPGVRNLAISEAGAPHGLYYAPDPSSQIACTIGGNVAENAGGVHCLKYGLTVHNVMELKVVTADGDLVTIGGQGPDSPGYDLLALMTGSEGLLGIVVEATVRLLPRPTARQVLMGAFTEVGQAGTAVARIIGEGIIPAGLEMMDRPAIRAAEDFVHAGYPVDAAAILLAELDGTGEEVAELTARTVALLEECGASEVRVAASEADAENLWRGRKAAFPAVGRISPDYYCMDGTIPRKHLSRVLAEIAVLSGEFGLDVANVFHAGDGNLHPLILYDANRAGELARAEAFGGRILELCVAVGGTITGEHGVGFEKLDQMCTQFQEDELAQFHAIKAAFDAGGLLNPGKAIPTLHRCAELGAMHVHNGQLPFPELDRF